MDETGRTSDAALVALGCLAVAVSVMLVGAAIAVPGISPELRESVEAEVHVLRAMPPDAVPEPSTLRECLLHALAFMPESMLVEAHGACHDAFG